MSDYIRREDAVDAVPEELKVDFMDEFGAGFNSCRNETLRTVEALPPADVVQVVHGKWLPIVSYNNTYKCSECGRLLVDITDGLKMVAKHYPYCHCGAKMDGKERTVMSEDITFCYHLKCKNTKCERHASNITQHYVPHSFAFFKDCEHWDLPEVYFTTSGERKE